MKIDITYLVAAINRSASVAAPDYLRVLVNEDGTFPSETISTKDEYETLKKIHNKYVNYHFEYVQKMLCGFRKLGTEHFEVCYITTNNYIPSLNKSGLLLTFSELEERDISTEEYYNDLICRCGTTTFR
jgi:hypothetical protein